jgi:hypothetical protein
MKKLVAILFLVNIFLFSGFAQQVPRNLVVLEIGTGTWCQFCPAAANGADDLLANGYDVAVIKYHSGDDFQTPQSSGRISYYGISGFPTAVFDGLSSVVGGGGASQTMFTQYAARVNQRMAVQSAFTLDVVGSHTCLTNFNISVTANKPGTNNSQNLRLHVVVTETNIPKAWQGLTHVKNACRLMVPNQNGTPVSFASGNTQTYDLQFATDPSWVFENLELIVFLQDAATKEIFQGTKMMLSEFLPELVFDAGIVNIDSLQHTTCNGVLAPRVMIKNFGSEPLSNLDIQYHVNNSNPQIHTWSGSLAYLEEEMVLLPAIAFDVVDDNELVVFTQNPNGQMDECDENDHHTIIIPKAQHTPNSVKLFLRTDANPHETTWEITNSVGEVVHSGGPYTVPSQINQLTFDLDDEDCYTFSIYDSGGDGLLSPGNVIFYHGSNNVIYQGRNFGYGATTEFNTADVVGIENTFVTKSFEVFPNPLQSKGSIDLMLTADADVKVDLINHLGQTVQHLFSGTLNAGSHTLVVDASSLGAGFYMLSAAIGNERIIRKVAVVR